METDPNKYRHSERPAGTSAEPRLVEGKPQTQTGRPRAQSMHPDTHAGPDPRPGRQRTETTDRFTARDSQSTDSAMNADAEMSPFAARVEQTVKRAVKQSKATIRRYPLVMVGGAFALGIMSTRGLPKLLVRTAVALGLRVVVGRLLDASMTESSAS